MYIDDSITRSNGKGTSDKKHWMSGFSLTDADAKDHAVLRAIAQACEVADPSRHALRKLNDGDNKGFRAAALPVVVAILRAYASGELVPSDEEQE